jgi:predicted MFS family arabinose efflux permease
MVEPRLGAADAEDALVDYDRTIEPGTARAALAYPTFRRLYLGAFGSNIGSWMQNAVLGALALKLTDSASFVGLIVFAQLGPLLVFAPIGGALADVFDRRLILLLVSVEQLLLSGALTWLTLDDDPNKTALVLIVFGIGVGQAIYGPSYSAALPALVDRKDLAGAISLNSAQMNASRVIGPAIGGVLYAAVGVSLVFAVNTATYLIVIAVLLAIRLPRVEQSPDEPKGLRRLLGGLVVARQDRTIRRVLLTMAMFSLFSLPFVTQMPVIAERNLGIDADSAAFGLFYACLGAGAVIGSLSIGTVFASYSKRRLVRQGLGLFALSLAALAVVRDPLPAYPITVAVGGAYFGTVTALSTVLQEELDDRVRGRVLALWIMCFGGTVPIGGLIAGPVIEATSVTTIMVFGAVMAALLGGYAYLFTSEPTGRRARRLSTSTVDEALG